MPEKAQPPKIQVWVIAGTVIAALIITILTQFVVMPIKERMIRADATSDSIKVMSLRLRNLEDWQRDMQKWKERTLASGGMSTALRNAMTRMPSAQDTTQNGVNP